MSSNGRHRALIPEYLVHIEEDEAGGKPCFVAPHPEMLGCMAQGWSREEALRSLDEAREMYLRSLERDGLPIPQPQTQSQAAA